MPVCASKILSLGLPFCIELYCLGLSLAPVCFADRGQRDHPPDAGWARFGTHREVCEGEFCVQWPRWGRLAGHPAGWSSPSCHHAAQSGGYRGSQMGKVHWPYPETSLVRILCGNIHVKGTALHFSFCHLMRLKNNSTKSWSNRKPLGIFKAIKTNVPSS